jgi:superfamily II DNA/RNA helicase
MKSSRLTHFFKFINFLSYLFSSCQKDKNVCVFSATYPHQMDKLLCKYMNTPILIRLNADDVQLLGIKQYAKVAIGKNHTDELIQILNSVTYSQCLVFVNEIE